MVCKCIYLPSIVLDNMNTINIEVNGHYNMWAEAAITTRGITVTRTNHTDI